MQTRRRKRLAWNRVIFLFSCLVTCCLYQVSVSDFLLSAPRRAQDGEGSRGAGDGVQGRRLLESSTNPTIMVKSTSSIPSPNPRTPGTPSPRGLALTTVTPTPTRTLGPETNHTPQVTAKPVVTEKPRLRGCILVGNEIIPATTTPTPTTTPFPNTTITPPNITISREPPLAHTKGDYPQDLFSVEERRQGWVVLHLFGMMYMFVSLALVCDEFFVPALGTITTKLDISDDVAGATFMAAGGSAPELFTSLIGVFISHSNVGIGTIVGSAVFNILFVIGMCAVFSREILNLTWWPLFRDVSFYILDLIMLIIFFLDNIIVWWESMFLFSSYILYVSFMKYNSKMEKLFRRYILNNSNIVKVLSLMDKEKKPDETGSSEEPDDKNRLKPKPALQRGGSTASLHNSTLRSTIFQLMIHTLDPLGEEVVADGNVKPSMSKKEKVKFKDKAEIMKNMTQGKGNSKEPQGVKARGGFRNQKVNKNEKVDKNVLEKTEVDKNEVDKNEKLDLPNTVNVEVTPPSDSPGPLQQEDAEDQAKPTGDQKPDDEDPGDDGGGGSDGSDKDDEDEDSDDDSDEDSDDDDEDEQEDDEEPLSLEWPDTLRKQATYLFLLPIVFPLWLTLPDVRNHASKKFFPITFIGSILWIGAFSYLMVWWAHQVGETIGISEEIMGLTILAAGTSIPDLITSVIVARKGLGDMAVSSSVGSNIFDITVGLPIPWLLFTSFNSFQPVAVSSNGLFCAIVLLFLMLLFVIMSIGLSKWKMNKFLGFTMFGLYFVFLIISVLLEDRFIVCPVSI
ncbi:LOW QUALITY PROTEIN: sodium/potassium/calcium exchanger 1 [Callorhinchus milii]|uniref:LOW QUALITY PROTEIN: sodium/potassium/calcium exchanger 1 n=1 Tax=Callorhinchus milii TaxID=7868 RepID=UPI0004573312|nr:LOW QUALITY PROTEIN: sodium/potassium/calcium exchanger 1 [Callorhinchus milii]|eukprot:gi/632939135/ref/XP_007907836.1/ PREDICTED: sodium/potassium/calcium exchanger 1 [Callorhinchus milii]